MEKRAGGTLGGGGAEEGTDESDFGGSGDESMPGGEAGAAEREAELARGSRGDSENSTAPARKRSTKLRPPPRASNASLLLFTLEDIRSVWSQDLSSVQNTLQSVQDE